MQNEQLDVIQQVPSPDDVRERLAHVTREANLLRRLLRISLRADECRQQYKDYKSKK